MHGMLANLRGTGHHILPRRQRVCKLSPDAPKEYLMSDKIFVHYPAYLSKKLTKACDNLIRAHPTLSSYRDHVEISGNAHSVKIVQKIVPLQAHRGVRNYLLYAALFVLMNFSLPPSPSALRKRPLYHEDKVKARYHFRELDDCAAAVFLPAKSGKWPYFMWRNARRLMRQQKQVWQVTGDIETGLRLTPLAISPSRALRQNREETMSDIVEYAEPQVYPSLFTLIRDAVKGRERED